MDVNIELGETMSETAYPSAVEGPKRKYYPTFRYSHKGDSKYDFPAEGEMTVRFKKVNETESTDEESNTQHSCTFEIHAILSVEGADEDDEDMPSNKSKATEDALDAIFEAHKTLKRKENY